MKYKRLHRKYNYERNAAYSVDQCNRRSLIEFRKHLVCDCALLIILEATFNKNPTKAITATFVT